jgi:uncharacterized protein YcbK (DUF882 family)
MSVARAINRVSLAACLIVIGSLGAHHAQAVGDTRTLSLRHVHTDEALTITYKKNGEYDEEALKKINWIMRDWRKNEAIAMDREGIDLLWQVYQEVGAKEPIQIICGYRSSNTNEMLRGRSKRSGVARNSQHTQGKAIDFYIPGVPLEKLRETAMRLQGGGVGYYPTSGSPFVHLDIGNVRAWPRMTREQLVKLFPDGRTVHLPSSGDPLPGYELAKADIERGDRGVAEPKKRTFLASLFGRDKDSEEVDDNATAREASSGRSVTAKSNTTKPEPSKLVPARVQVASAAQPVAETPVVSAAPVPLPPRRPIYQIAASEARPAFTPREAAAQVAELSPNEVVNTRGIWDDATPAAAAKIALAETNALSVSSARRMTPRPDVTASIGPFPTHDRVPADMALAYAAQANTAGRGAAPPAAVVTSRGSASIANKPSETIAQSRLTQAGERLDDPWLRGLVLAPSVQNSLVVTQVGDPDLVSLAQFMRKPASSVLMTFSDDPYLGMTDGRFSGSAVVFPATVTFATSRRTASLQ